MKVEFINPFVNASFMVINTVLSDKPGKGALAVRPTVFTSQECNIFTGVTGSIKGVVIYGMTLETADRIAAQMLGMPVSGFDELAASAIAELGNMITGNAITLLSRAGFVCDITPPSIVRGPNVKMSTLNIPALVIPICMKMGVIELTVSLQER